MTETIKKQIEAIRRSGETNMLDVDMVQWIANRENYFELVIYLEEHRKEYANYLFTGKAETDEPDAEETVSARPSAKPRPEEPKPKAAKPRMETLQTTKEEAEAKLSALFDELVPMSGKADTVAGEIVCAISRIGYRNYNDGDHIGIGYGRETCNPAARYLAKNAGENVAADISDIWGVYDDDRYDDILVDLEVDALAYLEAHPELKSTSNHEDMFDYQDEYEDVDNDEKDW